MKGVWNQEGCNRLSRIQFILILMYQIALILPIFKRPFHIEVLSCLTARIFPNLRFLFVYCGLISHVGAFEDGALQMSGSIFQRLTERGGAIQTFTMLRGNWFYWDRPQWNHFIYCFTYSKIQQKRLNLPKKRKTMQSANPSARKHCRL